MCGRHIRNKTADIRAHLAVKYMTNLHDQHLSDNTFLLLYLQQQCCSYIYIFYGSSLWQLVPLDKTQVQLISRGQIKTIKAVRKRTKAGSDTWGKNCKIKLQISQQKAKSIARLKLLIIWWCNSPVSTCYVSV